MKFPVLKPLMVPVLQKGNALTAHIHPLQRKALQVLLHPTRLLAWCELIEGTVFRLPALCLLEGKYSGGAGPAFFQLSVRLYFLFQQLLDTRNKNEPVFKGQQGCKTKLSLLNH